MATSDSTIPRKRWRAGRIVSVARPPYQPLPPLPPKVKKHRPRDFQAVIADFNRRSSDGEPPMTLLREFAAVRVPNKHPYKLRRYGKMRLPKVWEAPCFSCQRFRPVGRHHVIQVQHGGPNNRQNLVYLCQYCHAEIHPWLHRTPDLPEERYRPALAVRA